MGMEFQIQDPKELFDLLLDVRELSKLWLKTRLGTSSQEEKEKLGKMIRKLAGELKVLPFRGRLLQYILKRRPVLFSRRWTTIPAVVDSILSILVEYLTYRCDHVIWEDIIRNPEKTLSEYLKRNLHRREDANGHIFEIVVRRWLCEFQSKHWINVQRIQIPSLPKHRLHGVEIDAFSITKEDDHYNLAVAEIKWTINYERALLGNPEESKESIINQFITKLQIIDEHFKRFIGVTPHYREVAIISGNALYPSHRKLIHDRFLTRVVKDLSSRQVSFDKENIKIYDLYDIWETVKNSSHPIKNVVKQLMHIRDIR